MTDEEKKAYNFYKGCNEKDLSNFEYFSEPSKKQIKYMETVLNLIQKQNRELEKKDKRISDLEKMLNAKEILSNQMPKDTEFVVMCRADYERNFGKVEDK